MFVLAVLVVAGLVVPGPPEPRTQRMTGLSRRRFLGIAGVAAAAAGAWRVLGTPPDAGGTAQLTSSPSTTASTPPSTVGDAPAGTVSSTVVSSTTAPPPVRIRQVICPEAWGGQPAGEGLVEHVPVRLTLHHTAVALAAAGDAPAAAVRHQAYHRSLGWADLAYHFLVDGSGNVYRGRPVEFRGDTATDYNPTGHLLVCCEGDFDTQEPTQEMLEAVADLFAWGSGAYGIASDSLAGHRDVAATSCPGDHLHARLGELRDMIDERLAGGGVVTEAVCGAEGERLVASIRREA